MASKTVTRSILCSLPASQTVLKLFRQVSAILVFHCEEKDKAEQGFPDCPSLEGIIPLKNYPWPQFLQKFKAEILQFQFHSLNSQFLPQIVHWRCFYLLLDRLPTFELGSSKLLAILAWLILVTQHTMRLVNGSTAVWKSLVRNLEAD